MDLIAVLRTFLRVADTGSFSAVAAELGVTQPAISVRGPTPKQAEPAL
jgi:DNA-binding transcriptional LysR family regulator